MFRTLPNVLLFVAAHLHLSQALPTGSSSGLPTAKLDNATVTGFNAGTVNYYLGIPYAQSPTGDRRLRLAQPFDSYTTDISALYFGNVCPQLSSPSTNAEKAAVNAIPWLTGTDVQAQHTQSIASSDPEDCLNLDVVVPANATPDSKLPVVIWIYGGSFTTGSTSGYDGGLIVSRSVEMGEPVIYVAMNYRLSGYGFLASKEVKAANIGNLGLQDQRQAFRWVQKYITSFGGDPSKVTIWGESAGAVSVSFHLIANNGNNEGLFRAAIMQSGSPFPIGDVSNAQPAYDFVVSQTGCNNATDTLECLRGVPFASFKAAVDASPAYFNSVSTNLDWKPRVDGVFVTDVPTTLLQQGKVAAVPFISGDCDDEGTLFAASSLNVTTDADFKAYLLNNYLSASSDSDLNTVMSYYPSDIRAGSPFNTGYLGALTYQYKRMAAFVGDFLFHAPRRYLLQQQSPKQNTWAFLSKRFKTNPAYGSIHASDLLNSFGHELRDYLINFVTNLDPNGSTVPSWPKWTTWAPALVTFLDGAVPITITYDTFRASAMSFLTKITNATPV